MRWAHPALTGVPAAGWDQLVSTLTIARQAQRHTDLYIRRGGPPTRKRELAALTQLCTDDGTPGWAFQQITAVAKEHRGHRLGLLVKAANLQQLTGDDPGARRILTGNAGANKYMIAINEMLGFRVSDQYREWSLDITPDIGTAG